IGGTNRHWLAKLSIAGRGLADTNWNPHPNLGGADANAGGVFDLAVVDADLFVAGNFDRIAGRNCAGLAKLDASGAGAAVPYFGAPSFGGPLVRILGQPS